MGRVKAQCLGNNNHEEELKGKLALVWKYINPKRER
jgi:hypothetical protein